MRQKCRHGTSLRLISMLLQSMPILYKRHVTNWTRKSPISNVPSKMSGGRATSFTNVSWHCSKKLGRLLLDTRFPSKPKSTQHKELTYDRNVGSQPQARQRELCSHRCNDR